MLQGKINKAYPALKRMSEYRIPLKKARSLYLIIQKVKECFDFSVQEQRKYADEFLGTLNRDGTISFPSPDMFAKFQEKMMELNNLEIEWDFEPIILTEQDVNDMKISLSDMEDLDGFVIFE